MGYIGLGYIVVQVSFTDAAFETPCKLLFMGYKALYGQWCGIYIVDFNIDFRFKVYLHLDVC